MTTSGTDTTQPTPSLRWDKRPAAAQAVVLVLHGGRPESDVPTQWFDPAVLRLFPVARVLARAGRGRLAVARVRYAVCGWNDAAPVRDVRWALEQVRADYPGRPIGLVGYSMGGRAALRLAGEDDIAALVTLAAWIDAGDTRSWAPHPDLPVLLLHGADDKVTDPAGSAYAAGLLTSLGARARAEIVPGSGHAMVSRARLWHRRLSAFVVSELLGR